MSDIGRRIKELRLERHWSQEYLAEKAGIGQQYISKYESGKMIPTLKTLEKLAGVFGVSADFLQAREKIDLAALNIKDEKLLELLDELDSLNEEDLLTVKNVIEALVYRRKKQG